MIGALCFAYGVMVVAQTKGPEIIELLHGPRAREEALAQPLVEPDSTNLCAEYEAAHFDAASNILHTEGMVASLALFGLGVVGRRWLLLASVPPTFYLPAWIGHFVFQKDIPAVFSYGTTLQGWARGEYCSLASMFSGRSVTNGIDLLPSTFLAICVVLFVLQAEASSSNGQADSNTNKSGAATARRSQRNKAKAK